MQEYPAGGRLAGIVHSYLQVSTAKPTPYPMIPDGSQAIFISADSIRIGGAQSRALEIPIRQAGDYFGIRFYPGALRHFFKLNLSEITDQFVDHRYLPCREFAKLHERIYEQDSFQQRVAICETWLLRHFTPQAANKFDFAREWIYRTVGDIEIGKLADHVGLSSRHLNRMFQQYTGLTTKAFAQIVRIQQACRRLLDDPAHSLQVAVELGFADQAHLLKEYRRRLLASPGALSRRFMSDFYNRERP